MYSYALVKRKHLTNFFFLFNWVTREVGIQRTEAEPFRAYDIMHK